MLSQKIIFLTIVTMEDGITAASEEHECEVHIAPLRLHFSKKCGEGPQWTNGNVDAIGETVRSDAPHITNNTVWWVLVLPTMYLSLSFFCSVIPFF